MDPATAFQLACGVLQLVEVGIRVSRNTREIWKSGSSIPVELDMLDDDTGRLEKHICSIESQLTTLKAVDGNLARDQQRLLQVAKDISHLTHDLLNRICAIKLHGQSRKRDVPGQLLRVQRSKRKIDEVCVTLQRKQGLLNTSLLIDLW